VAIVALCYASPMPSPALSWLSCIGCGATAPLYGTLKFTCPKCGGLYDVEHDFSAIKKEGVDALRKIFDGRTLQSADDVCSRSGVWRFKELVMPSLANEEIVSLGEGVIPMWRAGSNLREWVGGDLDLWMMPEGLTPTGSFKDFGGTVAISVAKASGVKAIACASTGDTSAMAAAYAAAAGMQCAVVLPKGQVTDVQLAQPVAHGAKVVLIPGSFDECMRVVRELVDAGRVFPINSINPTRIEGHQASVFLANQFFGWQIPEAFVVPVGNGSNSSSIGKGMRLLRDLGFTDRLAMLIGVQSDAANPLATSWETTQKDGYADPKAWLESYKPRADLGETSATAARIGAPVSYQKVMREIDASRGAVLTALERDLNEAVMVAGRDGHLVCPQTGTALAGLRQAVERGFVKPGARVVVISTATGLKFPGVATSQAASSLTETASCDTEEVAMAIGV